jgi:hypothetical protein
MEPRLGHPRLRAMNRPPARVAGSVPAVLLLLAVVALAAVSCTSAAPAATPASSPAPTANPSRSPAPTANASPPPAPTANPSGSPAPTADTAEAALAAIRARSPWFDGVGAKDPGVIGQASWYVARPFGDGWSVTITVGWGDCPSGCIDRHVWTWHVARDGAVEFVSQTGAALSADLETTLAAHATTPGVGGTVTSGPSCPVQKVGDTACDPKPLAGAVLVVRSAAGAEVARLTTDASGLYRIPLPAGDYSLEPQPVQGLMGTAPSATFTVQAGGLSIVPLSYDTGIR